METKNKSEIAIFVIFDIEQAPIETLVQCNQLVCSHIAHSTFGVYLFVCCMANGEFVSEQPDILISLFYLLN